MRAYVLARKGILMTDPSVKHMTPAQWAFEYIALNRKERDDKEFHIRSLKSVLITTLGLNLLKPEDQNGHPKGYEAMNDEERESFIPLTAWTGNEGMLKAVREQHEKGEVSDTLPDMDSAYDDMVAAIDAAEGDIEPIIGVDKFDLPANAKKVHEEKISGVMSRLDVDGDI